MLHSLRHFFKQRLSFPPILMKILIVCCILATLTKIILPRTSLYYRYVLFEPLFGNYLTKRDVVLISGESFQLSVKTINKRLRYSSTDFKVAYVNSLGKVTAYQPGLAFVEVTVDDKVLKCRVRVLKLNHESLTLVVGEKKTLNVRGIVFFESYCSSNASVAKVSRSGKVTAIHPGTATITASAKGRNLTCTVTVKE